MSRSLTEQIDRIDRGSCVIAAVPALLLCVVTFVILVLDLAVPAMSEKQYLLYPLLIRISSAVSLICAAGIFMTGVSSDMLKPDAGSVLLLLFLLCIMISTVLNGFDRDALLGVQFRYIGVFDMITLIIAYKMCSKSMNSQTLRKVILIAYMIVADLITVVFIADWKTGMIDAFRNKNEPAAIFFHGNHYGYFLVISVVVCAGLCLCSSGILRSLSAVSLTLNLLALAMNHSMGCILAVAAVFAASVIYLLICGTVPRSRVLIITAAIAMLTALLMLKSTVLREDIRELMNETLMLISGDSPSYLGHGRLALWEYTIELIKERPLAGYGCEGITGFLGAQFWYSDNPHNEVLTYAAYYGIPAAIFYTAAVISTLIKGIRSGDSISMIAAAAAAAYFISSLFGVAMFYIVPFFFVMLGLADGHASIDNLYNNKQNI